MRHTDETKQKALELCNSGLNSIQVAKQLDVPDRTIRRWLVGSDSQPLLNELPKSPLKSEVKAYDGAINQQLQLDIKNGTVVVFSDAHIIPGQELSSAAQALLKVCELIKPEYVINGGDTYDFASISRHDKLGWDNQFTVAEEIAAGSEFLTQVYKASPNAHHYMLEGNHDTRLNKFLSKHTPQFKGLKGFDFRDHIPEGWNYTMSILVNKNTMFLHNYHSGVHAAYNNTIRAGLSIISGHTHILEVKPFSDYNGVRFGVQTGTLSTIKSNPLFNYTLNTPLNWQAGFVVLTYVDHELQYPEICYVNNKGNACFRGVIY